MKVNEYFYSLQGEGFFAGKPAVFVRFSGCNVRCPFCDTKHQYGVFCIAEQLYDAIKDYPTKFVVLTGGEPTLHDIEPFVEILHKNGYFVAMETNGTNNVPAGVDWLTLSPKFEFAEGAYIKLRACNELKVVFTGENDFSLYDNIYAEHYYLQPCDTGDKTKNKQIVEQCVEYIKANPKWKLSLQTQKILNIR